jgi:hypothetical protein
MSCMEGSNNRKPQKKGKQMNAPALLRMPIRDIRAGVRLRMLRRRQRGMLNSRDCNSGLWKLVFQMIKEYCRQGCDAV